MWLDRFEFELITSAQKIFELFKEPRFAPNFNQEFRGRSKSAEKKLERLRAKAEIVVGYWGWNFGPLSVEFDAGQRKYTIRECDVLRRDVDIFFADWNRARGNIKEIKTVLEEPDGPLGIVWFVDHHHAYEDTLGMAKIFDLYCCAHGWGTDYLNAAVGRQLVSLPCSLTQWRQDKLADYMNASLVAQRSNALYGGFKSYSGFSRDPFLAQCQARVEPNNIFFRHHATPAQDDPYFSKVESGRFHEWCAHKTSLVAAVNYDIPMRLFDALVAGQIPLIPDDIVGLDNVISPEMQLTLPIVIYKAGNVNSVVDAHKRAVGLFDRDGMVGIQRRSQYGFKEHSVAARMRRLVFAIEVTLDCGCKSGRLP